MLATEIPALKKGAVTAGLAAGIEVANGAPMSVAAQSAAFMGFCSLLTDTVFQQGAHLIGTIVPESISDRFAAMNVDIVQNLATGAVYAVGGRYFGVAPMDDMVTFAGLGRSLAYATTVASASEVICRRTQF